jgi:uncharacterized protein involved in exopolysaccharide biosynthesis
MRLRRRGIIKLPETESVAGRGEMRALNDVEIETGEASPIAAEGEISLLDLLIIVARHRRLILRTTIGMVLIGVLLCLLLPNKYTATTAILPPQGGSSAGSALLSQLGSLSSMASLAGGGSLGLKNPNDLQVALLRSRTVEDAMVNRYHLMTLYHAKRESDARKKLESRVAIDNGAKDGLIRISVTDSDPHRAADLANGYVEEYKNATAHLAVSEASQRRLFFEQQLSGAKDNLANAEEALKKTEQSTGLIQLDSQARAVIASVAQLRAQIAAKEVQIQGERSFATAENPDLRMAEDELAGLKVQLEKTGASSDEMLIPRGNLQQSSLEYVRKLRDVKYYETIFDLLARQYEVAKVDEARQGAVVQVVDPAIVPDNRSWPKPSIILPVAALAGFFLAIVWSFLREAVHRIASNPLERSRLETLKGLLSLRRKRGALS